MAGNGLDLQKLFAMQAQLKKEMKPLKGIEKEKNIEILLDQLTFIKAVYKELQIRNIL